MKLRLIDKKHESADTISFVFKPASPLKWQAGQFLKYHLPDFLSDTRGENRYFYIASSPVEKNVMLTTKFSEDEGSFFKKHLLSLSLGDQIEVEGPYGKFVIEDPKINYVFIAGG